ncbi:MAG: type II toxin-antitoxin system RelE/ParE family toxin [Gammaproteobacteria bacterium]|nr:MAG: type II toxin-antitoxin system RelE/ParE family toxin [Gammaproteobacteria bacterium]
MLFHPDTEKDIKKSYLWYKKQSSHLGDDFLNELEQSYKLIKEQPNMWLNIRDGYKKFNLNKFPFSIIYKIDNSIIYVVAIMHQKRQPDYWINRH